MAQYSRKKLMSAALEFEQYERLKELSALTRIPMQVYIREAIDLVLKKYGKKRQ